ncbi:guanine nucleotide-binding protein g(o) subunit alpha [Anaeramoeba ignava]|uniref:Guanine nucleotide-binding protein g(O) subunit alpha n=1 Tax=Anaeramoeba ignava TaxID=1746090 RepID=A0A9Q0LJ03_ANAIG|nr:guanine nucleotide-binding protein g(o) subunit alpha [Anaeramoeba ignava]
MGNSNPEKSQIEKNKKIEEQLQKEAENYQKEVKLLILGSGESGKSTFVKQIKILFQNGFSKQEKIIFRRVIQRNLIDHTKVLIKACKKLQIKFKPENEKLAKDFVYSAHYTNDSFEQNIANDIQNLWKDPAIKNAYRQREKFHLPESAGYFFRNMEKIISSNYQPTDSDILLCRIPTTGVQTLSFVHSNYPWRVIDVGGQRSERRKWIHHFDNVTVLIFIIAISEFDQKLMEDETTNRLEEALELFKKTINNQYFSGTNCILIFNKIDMFKLKLKKRKLADWFPDYTGGNDFESACEFIQGMFMKVPITKKSHPRKIISHFACATNTQSVKQIFNVIEKQIVTDHMKRV